jgi:hypothetical protein
LQIHSAQQCHVQLVAGRISGFHIPAARIKGDIAVPDRDPKQWRGRPSW